MCKLIKFLSIFYFLILTRLIFCFKKINLVNQFESNCKIIDLNDNENLKFKNLILKIYELNYLNKNLTYQSFNLFNDQIKLNQINKIHINENKRNKLNNYHKISSYKFNYFKFLNDPNKLNLLDHLLIKNFSRKYLSFSNFKPIKYNFKLLNDSQDEFRNYSHDEFRNYFVKKILTDSQDVIQDDLQEKNRYNRFQYDLNNNSFQAKSDQLKFKIKFEKKLKNYNLIDKINNSDNYNNLDKIDKYSQETNLNDQKNLNKIKINLLNYPINYNQLNCLNEELIKPLNYHLEVVNKCIFKLINNALCKKLDLEFDQKFRPELNSEFNQEFRPELNSEFNTEFSQESNLKNFLEKNYTKLNCHQSIKELKKFKYKICFKTEELVKFEFIEHLFKKIKNYEKLIIFLVNEKSSKFIYSTKLIKNFLFNSINSIQLNDLDSKLKKVSI